MLRVYAQTPAVSFGNLHLSDLEYADDTILLSNDIEKLTAALSVYDRESRKVGLKVSGEKTKLMHVGEGPDPASLNIDGNAVEFADSFVYLGSTVTNNGDSKPEIERKRALSSNVMQALRKPLWRQQSISRTTKMRICNAAVLSVLLYRTARAGLWWIAGPRESGWLYARRAEGRYARDAMMMSLFCKNSVIFFFCDNDVVLRWVGSYKNMLKNAV